jgi:hypothetical protein
MDDPVGVPRLVASLRAGRGPRRYDEERGCYVYDVSFTASPPLTGRVRGVAEAFGVALDDRRQVLYRDFELRFGERDVVYVAGDSGSGKSVLLRALTEHLMRMKANDPRFFDRVCGKKSLLHIVIRLRNGSTLLAQPPVPETIKGAHGEGRLPDGGELHQGRRGPLHGHPVRSEHDERLPDRGEHAVEQ